MIEEIGFKEKTLWWVPILRILLVPIAWPVGWLYSKFG
jgi:hypothetical protein